MTYVTYAAIDEMEGITGFPHGGGDLFERLGLPDVLV
jgi:hypothetical protein